MKAFGILFSRWCSFTASKANPLEGQMLFTDESFHKLINPLFMRVRPAFFFFNEGVTFFSFFFFFFLFRPLWNSISFNVFHMPKLSRLMNYPRKYGRYQGNLFSFAVFNLEKTFKTTFSLLVLHMWLFLRRLKEEGKEGVEFGQYLYEIYNHDVELRVSKAGVYDWDLFTFIFCGGLHVYHFSWSSLNRQVNLLLTRWMKDLEKIFYGNIVAYDTAMLPEAKQDELVNSVWR